MLVSIIIPIYNAEEYIEECVGSVLNQTYTNIELLLINDGSTDNTGKMLAAFAEKDSRVRVFHKENGGTHTARNLGLDNSKGEYVMFMDPDDWLDLNTIQYLVEKIRENNLDYVRFNYIREFAGASLKKKNTFLEEKVYQNDECKTIFRQTVGLVGKELKSPENLNFLASVCFGIYKKSIISQYNIRFFNIRKLGTFSDGLFNIEFFRYIRSFLFVDKGFYHYRKTNIQSATRSYRRVFLRKQNLLFEKIYNIIKDSDVSDIFTAYYNRIAMGTMELCLNAINGRGSFATQFKEIKEILKDELHKKAFKNFSISTLPLTWKVYFLLMKIRFTTGVYFMTAVIRKIMNRG